MKPGLKLTILIVLLFFQPPIGFSQKDSTKIWADALVNCKSAQEGWSINLRIHNFSQKAGDQAFLFNTGYFLKAAAKSVFAKYLFYDLLYIFTGESKHRNLEKEVNLIILKMEHDPDFSNRDVKRQLYYFYTQFYYSLKEYYYAVKYLNLFLPDGATAFPENTQSNVEINALTTLAIIDRSKDSLDKSLSQFRAILELSKLKKNAAWEGIASGNLGYTLQLANRLQEAIPYYIKDEQLSIENNELGSALSVRISLGEIYLKLNKPDSALLYIRNAGKLLDTLLKSNKTESDPYPYLEEQRDIYSFLANYYHQSGDFRQSGNYFIKVFQLNDSIERLEKSDNVKQIVQRIEVDRNISEINELNKEIQDKRQYLNLVIIVAVSVGCVLILLSFFLLRLLSINKKLKAQNEIISQQRSVLEKSNGENYKLFSIISHDVRGPAGSVHRLLQLAGMKKLGSEDFEKILPSLLLNSTNLNATIESLLTWSTAQFNGIETKPEMVEVKSMIDKIIPLFQEQAGAKSIVIKNDCMEQNVFIDKNQFEIIIRNSISNAVKFSHPDSEIRFTLEDSGANIVLRLADTGVGMTEEQVDNVMKKSALNTTSGTTGEKGVGLGLKLVSEFIEKNSGTFKIDSTVGVGTTLIFILSKAGK